MQNKQTELSNCSRDLKMLTTRRANQQRAVTRKENKISDLTYRSNLTATESANLANLQRELPSDQQELRNRESEMRTCSESETRLILQVGCLKKELISRLETSEAHSDANRKSFRR
ncbi:hypothetical protein [Rickettsiella endosymbiont of Rhagonycha lignosa]|uniref:hypothetical protein n=1 Tax=Rickettsiella endosymbiont of Rhagonycha lignosa TaxID=3077937 RepID=UPI00313AE00D